VNAHIPKRLQPFLEDFVFASTKYGVDALLLAALCDRESNGGQALTPPGPAGTGDHGHGRGLMQIDDRFHAGWVAKEKWYEPRTNICYGAAILRAKMDAFAGDPDAEFLGVCAYNASLQRIRAAIVALPVEEMAARRKAADACTTGGEYGSDVFRRREGFRLPLHAVSP
jgi:soluble lytic murein transglycosylase-like protein